MTVDNVWSDITGLMPPKAVKEPKLRNAQGETFSDPYEWMRDKDSERVQKFVAEENDYCERRMAGLKTLRGTLFEEIKTRVQETDMSVPTRMNGYWYFTRTEEGKQYGIQCRVPIRGEDDWDPPSISASAMRGDALGGEEIVFDCNAESEGHDFFSVGGLDLSHDGRYLAYSVDTAGDERYDLRVRDLQTGEDFPEVITDVSGGGCITPDGQWLFYTRVDDAWRPYCVWRHRVGTPANQDVQVYNEPDERFWVGVGTSFDEEQIIIESSSKTTSEVLMLPVTDPEGEFRPFIERMPGVEYDVSFARFEDDGGDIPVALVIHNVRNPNFEIDVIDMRAHKPPYTLGEGMRVAQGSPAGCEPPQGRKFTPATRAIRYESVSSLSEISDNPEILQGVQGLRIEGIAMYRNFVALSYRANSLPQLAVMPKYAAKEDFLAGRPWGFGGIVPRVPGKLYSIGMSGNPSYDAPRIRYTTVSYTQPGELHEYDPVTDTDVLLKRSHVLGDFDPSDYAEKRMWVRVRDGEHVPVSLVWRRGLVPALEGTKEGLTDELIETPRELILSWEDMSARYDRREAPMFITGYGAYEISSDPSFSVPRLSLLDRGVLYAVPHVRGGGEMGRAWYEQGRKLNKMNTFIDFIDVTAALQRNGIADPKRTVANGGSAGGLLMGAVANMAPQLYAGIEADVPFVDALTSILDTSLPLTVTEWDEWGDPLHNAEVYRYMKQYSPYENVKNADEREQEFGTRQFPAMFITTSMNDTRVLYVEPLKWLARLQEPDVEVDAVAKIEVEAGHGGVTGRYKRWQEIAYENAWCLAAMGIEE
ncbi:S9 family peptidase [Bifidobacterium tissieri]|uniref:S9 family peptidase n=1 Tax=Bifidobacterium tissieri TaxID=1630162 RepID=A0A5M9ZL66_9BIFI|nr:S9 family peptidase [Bifidobacterium tissieri]KAA8828255.1 S9 family peptidase [Bifidobacterium tissieri]KAA8830358.1 S9 family peptidase [Bifidobacterium tissieri]